MAFPLQVREPSGERARVANPSSAKQSAIFAGYNQYVSPERKASVMQARALLITHLSALPEEPIALRVNVRATPMHSAMAFGRSSNSSVNL
jgi:hypothetical protein